MGTVQTTDALLAVVHQDGRMLAYVCGGPSSYDKFSVWFKGALEPGPQGRFDITKGALRIEGDLSGGTLHTQSGAYPFELSTGEDHQVGLYSAPGDGCKTGVIVARGSSANTMIQGSGCTGPGKLEQVTPDRPAEQTGFWVNLDGHPQFVEPATP